MPLTIPHAPCCWSRFLPDHLRLGALKAAQASRPPVPEQLPDPSDLAALIARLLPEPDEARGLPPDPMRDLDWGQITGRTPEPLLLAWLRWVPPDATARRLLTVEHTFLRAARAAGVTTGPDGEPVARDELSSRRRRRGS